MNRFCTVFVALMASGVLAAARAVPPTVTPSPGYDARLQEQRKAAEGSSIGVRRMPSHGRRHGKRQR